MPLVRRSRPELEARQAPPALRIAHPSAAPPTVGRANARRIRVAYCLGTLQRGGPELNAVRCAEQLDPTRFDIRIFYGRSGPLLSRCSQAGIATMGLPLRTPFGARALKTGWWFARFLTQHRVDVVHSHDSRMNVFAGVWSRAAGVPIIASRRWWSPPGRGSRASDTIAYRLAARVVANTERVARALREDERISAERIVVVPNFVEEQAFHAPTGAIAEGLRRELGIEHGMLVIGCVARLDPVKDHATLLGATARLARWWPTVRLVLIGDGPCRAALESQASELGIAARVVFAGERPPGANWNHLFDVSVLASRDEAFPNAIVEAMAAGRPVVATAVGALADAVHEGETGRLVPPGSSAAMAAAIDGILAHPGKRRLMGEAARRRAYLVHHANVVLPRLSALYEQVAAHGTNR
jgi:glycosyltransferase involved in cell wall biosynthesis